MWWSVGVALETFEFSSQFSFSMKTKHLFNIDKHSIQSTGDFYLKSTGILNFATHSRPYHAGMRATSFQSSCSYPRIVITNIAGGLRDMTCAILTLFKYMELSRLNKNVASHYTLFVCPHKDITTCECFQHPVKRHGSKINSLIFRSLNNWRI